MADSQRKTANLFDYLTMAGVQGYYLDSSGNLQESDYAAVTDYIPCDGGKFCLAKVGGISPSICLYDSNKQFLYGQAYNTTSGTDKQTIIVNSSVNASYVRFSYFYVGTSITDDLSVIMLNGGSTPLPYEPYGWQHSLRKLTTATEAVENPLYSDGAAITSYTIKGNTVQNGTPTPSNPVEVNGVGVRTENLAYKIIENANISANGLIATASGYNVMVAKVAQGQAYSGTGYVYAFFNDEPDIKSVSYNESRVVNIFKNVTAPISGYVAVRYGTSEDSMINEGSTTLPYEPYGYKIPISSANTTTTVYLGDVETMRKIRKLVITGNEGWKTASSDNTKHYLDVISPDYLRADNQTTYISSHYNTYGQTVSATSVPNGSMAMSSAAAQRLYIADANYTTNESFIQYLQEQYANGTPVTVWFVLANETTAVVNEPLMKIGTYADTLSNATAIPTTQGANSITIDTTVQPSEFTATWTGWHDASVKEKSENLFDKSTAMQGKQYNENGALVDVESNWYATDYIPVTGGETYIRSINSTGVGSIFNEYNNQKQFIGRYTPTFGTPFTVSEDAAYITFSINTTNTPLDIYMLNTGSTALPYEPYWK